MLGGQELLVIFLIILLLFGANKLPELARSLGQAKREFKRGIEEGEEEEEKKKKEEVKVEEKKE
ncbi:MAG: twin-arginine translocase TatA/TatE family subunit [Candidatus Hydrothermarchaeota archaeon]|nr:MAG: twin-arginine translocase TatA/TatE family subunit [Candidatus Hydrothermarchaeota archaeon]